MALIRQNNEGFWGYFKAVATKTCVYTSRKGLPNTGFDRFCVFKLLYARE